MSISINWQNLRSWGSSQNTAFEELCCQLAFYEKVPEGSKFIRKGTPDGGVECFWTLPNGDELGWQAKFFGSVEASQWKQLDDSVQTVLAKHPKLVSYTICLPLDRPDARMEKRKSLLDKWNERVTKWKELASNHGTKVSFDYWGEHEIVERLSREEHRGRYLFWFNEQLFSQTWFQSRLEESIKNVGPRYTPEVNVELPIAKIFDGLGRTQDFFRRLRTIQHQIQKFSSKATHTEEEAKLASEKLKDRIEKILNFFDELDEKSINTINFSCVNTVAYAVLALADEYDDILRKIDIENKKVKPGYPQDYGHERYQLRELKNTLYSLTELLESNEIALTNIPVLLLLGEAGTGKTHLLCDIAQNRVKQELPTVLLLGQQFNKSEPWLQIISNLKLSCDVEQFLGALEAAAEVKQTKALIFIDALNEGEGKKLWCNHIAGMLTTLSHYPRLGIAISVRSHYEDIIIPDHLDSQQIIRETHYGFADHEYEATKTFFDFYGIKRPSIPLLNPEFQNPLFLKLVCKGLQDRGMTEVPPGFHGITSIFHFLINSVNENLSKEDKLSFNAKKQLVQKALKLLAKKMADSNQQWLPNDEAEDIVNSCLFCTGYHDSLFYHLLTEGLLTEDRFYEGHDEWIDGIRFSYERFCDHLIVEYLLDEHLDNTNPSQSFLPDQPLGNIIQESALWINRGLIEALSIQVPERIQKELAELAPNCANLKPIIEAFIESLIWRKPSSIIQTTRNYIKEYILSNDDDLIYKFYESVLTIATNIDHPLNADSLHKCLKQFGMPERDSLWSIFLHYHYGKHSAVDRLVEWAWLGGDKTHINDESIRLCAIALTWFLTTSNRFLRDRATKALVSILTPRIHLLNQLILQFRDVNDLYILERLFAVAYGCAMRSTNDIEISKLAQNVYHWIFENEEPIPHILLRDYARGVIEVALSHQANLDIDIQKVRPPYMSEWPTDIPSREELKKQTKQVRIESTKDSENFSFNQNQWNGLRAIENSVLNFGDFFRYTISELSSWSSRSLEESIQPTYQEIYESFISSLTQRQQGAWGKYQHIISKITDYRELDTNQRLEISNREFTDEEINEYINNAKKSFENKLGKKKTKIFNESIIPYRENPNIDRHNFDQTIAQRWIFKRVLELGYDDEYFGYFDSSILPNGREENKAERIGKKYQWIAFHEFLARVSDHFEFTENSWFLRERIPYDGTWQISCRDIDPSCLLKNLGINGKNSIWWWSQTYNWDTAISDVEWLDAIDDLPSVKLLIDMINPQDNSQWFALENSVQWNEKRSNNEGQKSIRRQISYTLRSYIVKKEDIIVFYEWAIQQNFSGNWMPRSHEQMWIFLGEYCWSPAFEYHNTPYFHSDGWTQGSDDRIPRKVLISTYQYWKETGYDCSIDKSYSIYLPCQWLVDEMDLRWNGVEGHFYNEHGELIVFDPSINDSGANACLINRDTLLSFLDKNNYDILWTVEIEKHILDEISYPYRTFSGAFRIKNGELEGEIKMYS